MKTKSHFPQQLTAYAEPLLEAMADCVMILETPKKWVYLNQAARSLIGSDSPKAWSAAVHPDDFGKLILSADKAWENGESTVCELRVRGADSNWKILQHTFSVVTLPGSEGSQTRVLLCNGQDITEARKRESLLSSRHRLSAAQSMLDKLWARQPDLTDFCHSAQELIAQTVEATQVHTFLFKHPNDFTTLEPACDDMDPNLADTLVERFLHYPKLSHIQAGAHCQHTDQGHTYAYFPILSKEGCAAIFIICDSDDDFFVGKAQVDWLKKVGAMVLSLAHGTAFHK